MTSTAAGSAISFAELWSRREALLDTPVTVDAKVFFRLDCASAVPGAPPCVATGFVTDPKTEDLPLYRQNEAFPLYVGGQAVACGTTTLDANFSCMGWRHNVTSAIGGSLQYLVLGGKQTKDIGFIASKEP